MEKKLDLAWDVFERLTFSEGMKSPLYPPNMGLKYDLKREFNNSERLFNTWFGTAKNRTITPPGESTDYIPEELAKLRKEHLFSIVGYCNRDYSKSPTAIKTPVSEKFAKVDTEGLPAKSRDDRPDIPKPRIGSMHGVAFLEPFSFEVTKYEFQYWNEVKTLFITATILDRNQPLRKLSLVFSQVYEAERPDSACIRELLLVALRHEVEECIKVDGVRIWDPHHEDRWNI